jgi:hypothetical protein
MKHAINIFRKDVRHLWPRIALVIAAEIVVLNATAAPQHIVQMLSLIATAVCIYLVQSAIHQEPIPRDRPYWLTRPFSRTMLLTAKAIFAALCLSAPMIAIQSGGLLLRTQSLPDHLPHLALNQFFFWAYVILPGAASAVVTSGLVEFTWMSLASLAGFYALVLVQTTFRKSLPFDFGDPDWGGFEWVRGSILALFAAAVSAAVIWLQFRRRETRKARSIIGAALLLASFQFWMPGWHSAFALQSWLRGPVPDSVAHVAFDPSRDLNTMPQGGAMRTAQKATGIWIPVRVSGIPAGARIYTDRANVTIAGPDGVLQNSGWDALDGLVRGEQSPGNVWEAQKRLDRDGEYWFYANVDWPVIQRPDFSRLRWHVRLALTLFSAEETAPLAIQPRAQKLPHGGECWVSGSLGHYSTTCSWLGPSPIEAAVLFYSQTGKPAIKMLPMGLASYGPYSASGGFGNWAGAQISTTPFRMDPPPVRAEIISRHTVGHFERELDIPALGRWGER